MAGAKVEDKQVGSAGRQPFRNRLQAQAAIATSGVPGWVRFSANGVRQCGLVVGLEIKVDEETVCCASYNIVGWSRPMQWRRINARTDFDQMYDRHHDTSMPL